MLIKEPEQVDAQDSNTRKPQTHYWKTRSQTTENQKSDIGMKRCELCSHFARIYCQSDNASLCYDCDHTVHSSNFLVAKHSRTLLCHKCQSPTPWTASGVNLGRAATVCVTCLDEGSSQRPVMFSHRENDAVEENRDVHEDEETEAEDIGSGDESEDDDEDAENQVVPWSSAASAPVTASSSDEQFSSSRSTINLERLDACIDSEDDTVCSSKRSTSKRSTEISLRSFRPLKVIRSNNN
ncbi:hypothetical protein R6Q57_025928 [Mikania cordata]